MRVKGKRGWKMVDAPYRSSYTSPAYKGIEIGPFQKIDDDRSIGGVEPAPGGLDPPESLKLFSAGLSGEVKLK